LRIQAIFLRFWGYSDFRFCGETDQQAHIVRLDFRLGGGFIPAEGAAFGTAVGDDESPAGIRFCADWFHLTAAVGGAVTGIFIQVEGPEAEGAMIPGGIAQRLDFLSAMGAGKAAVVFGEAFGFHMGEPFFI